MSKSENKKSAPPKTPVASKAENATGQNGPTQRPLWTVGERIGHGGTRFIRIRTTVTGKRGIQLDWPIAAVYREDKAIAELICRSVNHFDRLIAVAPEQNEALREIIPFLQDALRCGRGLGTYFRAKAKNALNKGLAAIAKAEGRAS